MSTRINRLTGTVPATAFPAPLISTYRNGMPRMDGLYAAYIHGAAHRIGSATRMTDMSGNGRDLVVGLGTIPAEAAGSTFLSLPFNTYFTPPFSLDTLAAADVPNEFSMMFFGKVPTTADVYWMWNVNTPTAARETNFRTGTTFNGLLNGGDNVSTFSANHTPRESWRDTDFGCFGFSLTGFNKYSFTIHQGLLNPGLTAIPAASQAGRAIGGPVPRLFTRADGGTGVATQSMGCLIFSRVLEDEQKMIAYDWMQDFYAASGVVI